MEAEVKAEKRAQPLPPIREIEARALTGFHNCTKVELQALLEHYPENDIRHYALALDMSRRMKVPYPIADKWVQCRRGHTFSVRTAGMLFLNRRTYCKDCGKDVSVSLVPKPERTKEQRIADEERSSEVLELLRKGWKTDE